MPSNPSGVEGISSQDCCPHRCGMPDLPAIPESSVTGRAGGKPRVLTRSAIACRDSVTLPTYDPI